jgi:hypothetical protein
MMYPLNNLITIDDIALLLIPRYTCCRVLNCFTFFVFTSFVFMKILQDLTTSIISYVPTTICITHYISPTTQLKHVLF